MKTTMILTSLLGAALPLSAQLEIKRMDNPARSPLTRSCTVYLAPGTENGTCPLFTVPAGKRFVIEMATGIMAISTTPHDNSHPVNLAVSLPGDGAVPVETELEFGIASVFPTERRYFVTEPLRLYASPGQVKIRLQRSSPASVTAAVMIVLSGHLADLN